MAPLPGDAVMAVEDLAVDDDAGPNPCAHDDAEHHFRFGMVLAHRPQMGFRQGEAVSVVGDQHGNAEPAFQIFLERLAVQLCGVAVLHQPGLGIPRPRRAHAEDGGTLAEPLGALVHQFGDLAYHVLVTATALGGDAMAQQHLVTLEHHALALGSAKIDSPVPCTLAHPASCHVRRRPHPVVRRCTRPSCPRPCSVVVQCNPSGDQDAAPARPGSKTGPAGPVLIVLSAALSGRGTEPTARAPRSQTPRRAPDPHPDGCRDPG